MSNHVEPVFLVDLPFYPNKELMRELIGSSERSDALTVLVKYSGRARSMMFETVKRTYALLWPSASVSSEVLRAAAEAEERALHAALVKDVEAMRMSLGDAIERMRAERQRLSDLLRTHISPGADPRAQWDSEVIARDAPDCPYPIWEITASDGRVSGLQGELEDVVEEWGYDRASVRYVPHDVRRWRNAEHREALTQRSRAHAALPRPGIVR